MYPEKPKLATISLYFRNTEEKLLKINNLLNSLIEKYSNEVTKITLKNEVYNKTAYSNFENIKNYFVNEIKNKCILKYYILIQKDNMIEEWHFRDINNFKILVDVSIYNKSHNGEMTPISYEKVFDFESSKQYFENISYDTLKVLSHQKNGFLIGKSIYNIISIMEYIYHLERSFINDLVFSMPDSTWEMVDSSYDFRIIFKFELKEYIKKSIDNIELIYLHEQLMHIKNSSNLKLYIL